MKRRATAPILAATTEPPQSVKAQLTGAGATAHGPRGVRQRPNHPMRVKTGLSFAAQGELLAAAAIDAFKNLQQWQVVAPAPFSAQPGPQGLLRDRPPKFIVVDGA